MDLISVKRKLFDNLTKYCDENEIETFAFLLHIDVENLKRGTKNKLAESLIDHAIRTGRLKDLVQVGRSQREDLKWPENKNLPPINQEISRDIKTDRELIQDQQYQNVLDKYIDKMAELILEKDLKKGSNSSVFTIARTRTIIALKELDSVRQRHVMQFLEESNLVGSDGINFNRANFEETNLEGINFYRVDFRQANFKKANLKNVQFHHSDLRGTNFDDTTANNAVFLEPQLKGAHFKNANLQNSVFFTGKNIEINFTGALLNGTKFIDTYLRDVDFSGADLTDVKFINHTTLHSVTFLDTNITVEQIKMIKEYRDLVLPPEVEKQLMASTKL